MAQRVQRNISDYADTSSENSNTTGYTAFLFSGFQELGSDVEKWLNLFSMIEEETLNKPDKRKKYIQHFFDTCWQAVSEENRYSKSYAILRAKEALHYGETDVDVGREFFKTALNICRRIPLIHINYAQFELNHNRKDKAVKILLKSREIIESSAEVDEAMRNLQKDMPVISDEVIAIKRKKPQRIKPQPVVGNHEPVRTPVQSTQKKPQRHRNILKDVVNNNTYNGDLNIPTTPDCTTPEYTPLKLKKDKHIDSEVELKQSRFATLVDLKSPISPCIAPTSVQKRDRFRPSNPTWSSVKGRNIKPLKHETPQNKSIKLNEGSAGSGSDSTTGTKSKPRRVLMLKSSSPHDENKENHECFEEKDSSTLKPLRVQRTAADNIKSLNFPGKPCDVAEPPKPNGKVVCNSNAVQSHDHESIQPTIPKPIETKPIEACQKSDESELNRIQAIIAQANHTQQPQSKADESWKSLEIRQHRFLLMKLLGRGGSSKVFQAWDTNTKSIVAIKQVHLSTCDDVVLQGYLSEVKFLQQLQESPHIIKLFSFEATEKYLYLVMECGSTDFQTLMRTARANNTLTAVDVIFYWSKMLRCVQTIHKHGIVHLDLKPANFLLVGGTLKLIDFGIANSIQSDVTSVTKDTQFGTLNYMAPETISDISSNDQSNKPKFKVGSKADVWSMGCILYLMMYGCTPFQHIRHQALKICAITNPQHQINFPSFHNASILRIVQACLQRDPKIRPSIDDLLTFPISL